MPKGGRLHPIKHPQRDLWVPNILDATPKDDIASMEHPMFALVGGDMRIREYAHRGNWVKLTPSSQGLATIKDKDILIYMASQMVEALNRGETINRTVRFTPYNLLVFTERDTSGWGYRRLLEAFHRLRNTSIETNIQSGHYTIEEGFGWIDDWRIVRCAPSGRMESVEITICKWLWHAIMHQNVLTISPDYFRLRRPLERRLYELCRKHCGSQKRWAIRLETLHRKSGSTATRTEFRRHIINTTESNHLPDYRLRYIEAQDLVVVYSRGEKGRHAQALDTLQDAGLSLAQPSVSGAPKPLHSRKRKPIIERQGNTRTETGNGTVKVPPASSAPDTALQAPAPETPGRPATTPASDDAGRRAIAEMWAALGDERRSRA